jgi:hypothetical protein
METDEIHWSGLSHHEEEFRYRKKVFRNWEYVHMKGSKVSIHFYLCLTCQEKWSSMQILIDHNSTDHGIILEGSVTTGRHPPEEYKICDFKVLLMHYRDRGFKYSDFTFQTLHTLEASPEILRKSKLKRTHKVNRC